MCKTRVHLKTHVTGGLHQRQSALLDNLDMRHYRVGQTILEPLDAPEFIVTGGVHVTSESFRGHHRESVSLQPIAVHR